MHIIPIASGKGGVGKSLLSANLAIALSQAGRRVILGDFDLGASNLHLMLGMSSPRYGIGTFLSGSGIEFEDIMSATEYPNLAFIPGDAELPGLANLTAPQKNKLVKRLGALDADYLILDLGAGTHATILDFFLLSGQGIVVTAPALTATLNAYLFLKNAVFRLMYATFRPKTPAHAYLESLRKDGTSLQKAYIPDILDEIARRDPENRAAMDARLSTFSPRLVMNMLEDPRDAEKALKIRRSCREYLNLDLEHLGVIYRDDLQDVALASRLPIIRYKPQAVLSQAVYRIADKLMAAESEPEVSFDTSSLDQGFLEADLEAEADFDAKVASMEDLLHCGALTPGDLVETVRSQQYEISRLRKENDFIKRKLAQAMAQGFKA